MPIKQIYIARHGFRANWAPPPHPPNPTGIDSDPPLAPHGVTQSQQLAGYLASLPIEDRPRFILSSPFYRCVESCVAISNMLDCKVAIERGISEWFRRERKTKPIPADYPQLNHFFPGVLMDEEEWPRDRAVGVIPRLEGENYDEVFERCKLFVRKFIPIFEERYPQIENVLIVTHAASGIAVGSALLGLSSLVSFIDDDKNMIRSGACSVSKYVRVGEQWKIVMNGNCEFLTDGEEMNWDFRTGVEAGSAEDLKLRQQQQESHNQDTKTTVTEMATGSEAVNNDEFETFYVTVDLPILGKPLEEQSVSAVKQEKEAASTRTKVNMIKPHAKFQFTDLSYPNPLVKLSQNTIPTVDGVGSEELLNSMNLIDGKIFESSWKSLVGTDLIFDDYGELIGSVKEHLVCNENVKLVPKKEKVKAVEKEKAKPDEDVMDVDESEQTPPADGSIPTGFQTQFFKRAMKQAKEKEV
ncbi:Transcription factor tau 55 kDa subunit [Spathaspora sp. JA1]|nr:Transcription factor tau 55 kDa subunit [Spathaspora sp. JA1]